MARPEETRVNERLQQPESTTEPATYRESFSHTLGCKRAVPRLPAANGRSWPGQAKVRLKLVVENLSLRWQPWPRLSAQGDRPVVAACGSWRGRQ
jgi:hypothetical protein